MLRQKWAEADHCSFRGPKPTNPAAPYRGLVIRVVVKTGQGDPTCAADHPYGQTLNLKEVNVLR